MRSCLLHIWFLFTGILFVSVLHSQISPAQTGWHVIDSVESSFASSAQKLQSYYLLKNKFENYGFTHDSVYARILNKIGIYEDIVNNNYSASILFTQKSLRINIAQNGSLSQAVFNYFNIGSYYEALVRFDKSLIYYDSCIQIAKKQKDTATVIAAEKGECNIFFQTGDYEKCIEQGSQGIFYSLSTKDSLSYLGFLNDQAQSLFYEGQITASLERIKIIMQISDKKNIYAFDRASSLKIKGFIFLKEGNIKEANLCLHQCIFLRKETNDYAQVSYDYNDLGNFYNTFKNFRGAVQAYSKAIEYAKKAGDLVRLARVNVNLGQISFDQHQYNNAAKYYLQALECLKIKAGKKITLNPTADQLNMIGTSELVETIMWNKTELLLNMFKKSGNYIYLDACLQTALITDTLINKERQLQYGNKSKLYWRNFTRQFYTNALEACYLANNPKLAFFFMEKSRAVLLNDELNEIGAASHLPAAEEVKEERLQINITEQEQKLSLFNDTSKEYSDQQYKLLQAKEDFENYIRSLEQKYPVYYQYKYADEVPALNELQKYLAANKQSFVHYFIGDTVTYILSVTPTAAKFIRLSNKEFNNNQLERFLQLCSDKPLLNQHYEAFIQLSDSLYKILFQPLQLPKGRVIICSDSYLIPFEALCTDNTGKHFLISDYAFSYAYSARFLLKQFNSYPAKGDFLGIAPVSFAASLRLPDLKLSAVSLNASANYYHNVKFLTNDDATKNNFLDELPKYSVVNIFSHAHADSTGNEPMLYMRDSVIHLSELQLINNPATRLVVLSACQTNVGKNATGEGVYSLARGFAAAGIPSVAATLWKADEETIYAVTQSFNYNLSVGMTKDVALQQAELSFMQNNDIDKSLPFFWANMIIVGNTDPVRISADHHQWSWLIAIGIILLTTGIILWKRRKTLTE